jgi:rare lipoprotein A
MTRMPSPSVRARTGLAACSLAALLTLSACVEGGGPFGLSGARGTTDGGPAPIGATRLVERDVEAPEVFQITEDGLWDGRPSLGGVWVAHPTADDPERVIIRNEENGRFVIGALFRREIDRPGPSLMISSDAAAALNILAGDPTRVQVTALRREETPEPDLSDAATPPPPGAPEDSAVATPEITATPIGDPIAAAAAAISEAEEAQAAATPAAPTQAPVQIAAAAAPAAPAPAAAATSAPAATRLSRPFVQIGIFSVEENANNTAQALRNAGLAPTIYDQTTNGRRFWRVVVGPAQTEQERAAMLRSITGLGFADAYAVTR